MAGSYSRDLRRRVLAAVEAGASPAEAARRFAVGRSTAYRWAATARAEGRREAKRLGGGAAPRLRGELEAAMLGLAGGPDQPSLAEIAVRLAQTHGVRVHPTTVPRALRRAGWPCKRLSLRAAEPERADVAQARRAWRTEAEGVGGIAPERLVVVDAGGVLTNLARRHGPRGTRAGAAAPFGPWTRLTGLGALGAQGIVGAMRVAAATGAAVFHAYLDEVLRPELRRSRPDAVLVMDNLPAHTAPRVRALLDASGFSYRYLPAYAPDLNPIEPCWAKVKAGLRRIAARATEALHQALGPALDAVTPHDAAECFRVRRQATWPGDDDYVGRFVVVAGWSGPGVGLLGCS